MAVFIIISTDPDQNNLDSITSELRLLELPSFHLNNGEILVSFNGTSRELSDKLSISDGRNGPAIITAVSSYYGRTSTDVWEWMSAHWSPNE